MVQAPCQCAGRNRDPSPGVAVWQAWSLRKQSPPWQGTRAAINTSISVLSWGNKDTVVQAFTMHIASSAAGGSGSQSFPSWCVNSSSQPHTVPRPSPTAASFTGTSRYQTPSVWDAFEHPEQPKCVCTADPESEPSQPQLLPERSPPQCQPAHGHPRQEGRCGRFTVGHYHGPQQCAGELTTFCTHTAALEPSVYFPTALPVLQLLFG